MVRTRATTIPTPTPTPTRQGAPELTIGAAARGGAVTNGHGRGCGKRTTRGRGQAPGPPRDRAVNPPLTEEVVRKDDEREDEQIQEKEVPPQPTPEIIN